MATSAHCHVAIRAVAREAAGELYERLMGDNYYYEMWKAQNPGLGEAQLRARFVAKNWGKCVPFARATLAIRLRDPTLPPAVADAIMEALTLDATLIRGRASPMQIVGAL